MNKEHIISLFNEALETNNSRIFATTLNALLDYSDNILYNTSNRTWKLFVGYESTYSPSVERTRYQSVYYYHLDGSFSYENKSKVLCDGEDIFCALDRVKTWRQGYSYWDRHDCHSMAVLEIYGRDSMKAKFEINTGATCKAELLGKISEYVAKAFGQIESVLKARENFDDAKYGFEGVNNYRAWVAKYLPIILKNNGIEEKSWYDGISIANADCEFYTGRLKTCTPKGIIFWVGGDSTDDENKISYGEWASSSDYVWHSSHCGATARIPRDYKDEFSKKIYEYIKSLVRDGKLK